MANTLVLDVRHTELDQAYCAAMQMLQERMAWALAFSGVTQAELARHLGVARASVNAWVNDTNATNLRYLKSASP